MADLLESFVYAVAVVAVLLIANWRFNRETKEQRRAREKWEWMHTR